MSKTWRDLPWWELLVACAALFMAWPAMNLVPWGDEIYTLALACAGWNDMLAVNVNDTSPHGYHAIMWVWSSLFAPDPANLRTPSLLAHVATCWLLLAYCRRFHSELTGRTASLALALNPTALWFATNARCYAILVLLCLLDVFAYRERRWVLFTLVTAAIGHLHQLALLMPVLLYVQEVARRRTMRVELTYCGVASVLLCAPMWVQTFRATIQTAPVYGTADLGELAATFRWWFGLDFVPPVPAIALVLVLLVAILHQARRHALETWLWLAATAALAGGSILLFPAYHVKAILWTLPLALVCLYSSLDLGRATRTAAIGLLAVTLMGAQLHRGREKSHMFASACALSRMFGRHDTVYFTSKAREGIYDFYLRRLDRPAVHPATTWVIDRDFSSTRTGPLAEFRISRFEGTRPSRPTTWTGALELILAPESGAAPAPAPRAP